MSRSSELLELPGAVGAGLFSRKGLLEEFEGPFPATDAMASLCSALSLSMEMQGLLLDRLAGKAGWESCNGEVMWGSEMCVAIIRDSVCILNAQETSFNQVISAMRQSAGVEENSAE